jgi:hypothetical protein
MKKVCLNCKKKLKTVFLNLGSTPIANNFSKKQTPKKKSLYT